MKDPAFLFYSKDFYEGTRMMLPDERACYIDLLIYQHQNGAIPLDLKRVVMYCSGINEATLEATLEAKFERRTNGWINLRLENEIIGRDKYKNTQSDNGRVGQFFKKAKNILKIKEFNILSQNLKDKDFILNFIDNNEINIATLQGLVKRCLNNKGNGSVNGNEDGDTNEGEIEKPILTESEKIKSDLQILFDVFNEVMKTKYTNINSVLKNYEYWLKYYSNEEIETAITKIKNDNFWKDKMTPTILFRTKNTNKEDVDYIGGLLNRKPELTKKQEFLTPFAEALNNLR